MGRSPAEMSSFDELFDDGMLKYHHQKSGGNQFKTTMNRQSENSYRMRTLECGDRATLPVNRDDWLALNECETHHYRGMHPERLNSDFKYASR